MFLTPTEEKSLREKRQVETLQRTVVAKKAWLRVSELKRERGELDRVLKALQSNPSIMVGTQLEHKMKSLVRLKDADLDVAVHAAQLAESELQRSKMMEHEERVGTLQQKIAAVEGLKKEQSSRRKKAAAKAEEDKARAQRQPSQADKQSRVDTEEEKESGGKGSGGGTGDALNLVEKVDGAPPPSSSASLLSFVVPSPQPAAEAGAARGYPVRYFANCFQGLSTMYCKALLERPGWRPYPSEEWFVTEKTKLTIWSPLAKSAVDFCDTASFSTGCHALLWEGADHFEDKAKLADLLDGLHVPHHPQGALMPPTFIVPAAPKESDGGKEGGPEVWDGVVTEAMVRCAPAEGAKAWCERVREKGGVQKFFAKDSGRNFCTGIHVCRDLAAVKRAVEGGGGKEAFVVQEAVRSLELGGYRISCRAYVAVVSPALSREVRFFVYTEGWLSNAPKPAHEASANAAPSPTEAEAANAGAEGKAAPEADEAEYEGERNATNNRYMLFSAWDRYGEIFPRCEAYLQLMCGRLAPKLTVKEELPSFELFGVDFILGALPGRAGEGCNSGCDGEADRLWVCEVNRSPRQTETELPMLHALLDLVFDEKQSPPEAIEKRGAHVWKPITPLVPTPPPPPGA